MKRLFLIIIASIHTLITYPQVISPWRYDPSASDIRLWNLRRYEFSLGFGMTELFGDIGGFSRSSNLFGLKDITYRHSRIDLDPSLKYRVTENLTVRASFAFGYFHSIDERGSNTKRNFESSTIFVEPLALGEYHFLINTARKSLKRGNRRSSGQSILSKIDLYLFTGIGGISYDIFPNDLLEPRVTKKSGSAVVLPLGAGVNLIYSRYFNLGFEIGGRYAFSDNLDGYTSIYSKANDVYYLANLTLTYKIRTGSNGLPFFK